MFLNKIINFFKPEVLNPATMTMDELHVENCHEMEFGDYDNEFNREIERRNKVSEGAK